MTKVAVAAPSRVALEAGLEVADAGGNAVDAAIAASLTAMATEPGIVSLMGGAFVNIWPAQGEPVVVDGNVEMPGRGAAPERFGRGIRWVTTTYGGGVTMGAGFGSVANPGAVQALSRARDLYGGVSWKQLVTPAARVCRTGYPLGSAAASYLALVHDTLFADDPQAYALACRRDGGALSVGEVCTNIDLSDVLELLAAQGVSLFTSGAVGRVMVEAMAEHEGLITREDLLAYEPQLRVPTLRRLGDWTVALNPPPSIGGPLLAVMLGALSSDAWSWPEVIDVQRHVLSHRLQVHDLSPDLLTAGASLLEAVDREGLAGLDKLARLAPTSPSTAHVSAVDADGTACAITMSSGYGAGVVVPGTGILLNNALGEPELNRLGLHALEPGTRLASNMAPTTARSDAGEVLAVGSPGADRITTALMQVLGRALIHSVDLKEAIEAARVHVRFRDQDGMLTPFIDLEPDADLRAAVEQHQVDAHEYPHKHMYFGGVGAAKLSHGVLGAYGDSRREAAVGISS